MIISTQIFSNLCLLCLVIVIVFIASYLIISKTTDKNPLLLREEYIFCVVTTKNNVIEKGILKEELDHNKKGIVLLETTRGEESIFVSYDNIKTIIFHTTTLEN